MLIISNKYESLNTIFDEAARRYAKRDDIKALLADILYDEKDGTIPNDDVHFFLKTGDTNTINTNDTSYVESELDPFLRSVGYDNINYYSSNLNDLDPSPVPKDNTAGIIEATNTKNGNTIIFKYRKSSKNIYKNVLNKTDKSDTNNLTALREQAVLIAIKNKYTNNQKRNSFLKTFNIWLDSSPYSKYKDSDKVINYIDSAIVEAKCFYDNIKIDPNNYYGARQYEDQYNADIYNKAKQLCKEAGIDWNKDNWNPADIWFIKKSGFNLYDFLDSCVTLSDLNSGVRQEMENKNIIPISLKQSMRPVFDIMDENHVSNTKSADVNNAVISNIHLAYKGSKTFGSMEIRLANGYMIHGHARASSDSDIMYYQLVPPRGAGSVNTNSGISKSIVTQCVYKGQKITDEQRLLYNNADKSTILDVNKIIANIGRYINKFEINTTVPQLKEMYKSVPPYSNEIKRFIMTLCNLNAVLNTYNDKVGNLTVIQKLFLSGLKVDFGSGQCAHYKIH